MSDTVVGWASPLVRSAEASLADVLLCPLPPGARADELCDELLRSNPGAVVVVLVPPEQLTVADCLDPADALRVIACLAHTALAAGFAPCPRQVLPVRCPLHRRSAAPCGLLALELVVRRGFRQGFELAPHRVSP